jgi:large subunit ribosomal protein L10
MAHVAPYKKEIVKNLVALFKKYDIIGALNMENMPAPQLQKMRAKLRGQVELFMTKKRLMKIAIAKAKESKPGIEKIEKHLKGMPALLFTAENPFALYRTIKKSKSKAPAKAGQTAPSDITIPAGPTPFAPGPVIGELGSLGMKTKVEDGKINILEDTVVAKEGDAISAPLAAMLTRLSIEPMEIGLDLVAVYEKGTIYGKSVLDVDEDKFMADLAQAGQWALNLSVETGYINDDNKELLIQKAFKDSKALALEANIMADAVAEELVEKAEREAAALKAELPEVKVEEKKDEPKEEPKPEPKVEEKKEEPKPEPEKEEKKEEPKEDPKPEAPKAEEKPEPTPKVEEKPKEEVKEEPKPEPKVEEKKPEPAPEPEKKFETAEEQAKKASETEAKTPEKELKEKVDDMVQKTKQNDDGTAPTAEGLVEEAKSEVEKESEIAQQILKKGKRIMTNEEKATQPNKILAGKPDDVDEVQNLMKKLQKKDTLR